MKLYSWIAGVAIAVAAVSFARYSIDHGWLVPPVRMAIGVSAGLALLVGGETRRAQRYRVTAQALAAGGIASLFATFWASHAIWGLVPALPTFALLALVAAVAVVLSIRRDALVVALLGLAGGFATPFLLSTGEDRPIGLFSYLLLLNVGLSWVAHRRRWPILSALALALTAAYQAGWVVRFLDDPSELTVAAAVFLVFPLVGFVSLARARRGGTPPPLTRLTAALGAVPPALFAIHVASEPALLERWPLLLGFVAVLAAGLAAVAAFQGPEWLHLLGAGAALATAGALVGRGPPAGAWPGAGAFLVLLAAIDLAAPPLLARLGRPFAAEGRLGVWGGPLFLLVLAGLGGHAAALGPWAFAATATVLFAGCGLSAAARGDGPFQGAAAVAAIAALYALAAAAPGDPAAALVGRPLAVLLGSALAGLLALAVPLGAARAGRPLSLPFSPAPPVEAALLGAHLVALVVAVDMSAPLEAAPLLAVLGTLQLALVADALRRRAGALVPAGAAAATFVVLLMTARDLGPGLSAAALAVLVLSVLAAAWRLGDDRHALAGAAVAAGGLLGHHALARGEPRDALTVAVALALPPLAYPLLRGARGRGERLAHAGAVLASAALFLVARPALLALGAASVIGALPVVQALLLVPHLVLLARGGGPDAPPPPRGTLALVAGAALAFVTVAIPLQLDKQWITIGWALEAAALAWLWRRIPHRGLLAASAGLLAAVLVRLVLNPEILRYHPKSATPIWNWYLYAYLTAAAAAFLAARLLARGADRLLPGWPRLSALAAGQGAVLLFALVNVEIADFFSPGPRLVFRFSAGLAQDLTYTIAWAVFAIALLLAGVALASRVARAAAIALLSLTVLKAFLHDLARLDGLYRVASFLGLAMSLAAVAVVLQRFVLRPAADRTDPEAS